MVLLGASEQPMFVFFAAKILIKGIGDVWLVITVQDLTIIFQEVQHHLPDIASLGPSEQTNCIPHVHPLTEQSSYSWLVDGSKGLPYLNYGKPQKDAAHCSTASLLNHYVSHVSLGRLVGMYWTGCPYPIWAMGVSHSHVNAIVTNRFWPRFMVL